jgi:hypothetical protein
MPSTRKASSGPGGRQRGRGRVGGCARRHSRACGPRRRHRWYVLSGAAPAGWLIFGLPPAEVAVHPGEENDVHELYLMTDDLGTLTRSLGKRGIACSAAQTMSWGVLTQVTLPGGGKLGVYQPRHARPKPMATGGRKRMASTKRGRKADARRKPAARRRPRR